jgi:Holliday junction resolvasome RuvABC DNA-binding subunit
MIDSIRGTVESLEEQYLLLRVGSVVLRLLVPGYFLRRLSPGESAEFPVYFHFQMEGNRAIPLLVAFPDITDRQFFESFISVSGVGVRAAVKALARPVSEIASAIAAGDTDLLRSLPGIGNARAKQIVASLQDEMKSLYGDGYRSAVTQSGAFYEARSVLMQLGIPAFEVDQLLGGASAELDENATASDLVRMVMRERGSR